MAAIRRPQQRTHLALAEANVELAAVGAQASISAIDETTRPTSPYSMLSSTLIQ